MRAEKPVLFTAPAEPLLLGEVVLRMPDEADAEALVRAGDDPDLAETLWVPIPSPCSHADAVSRVREFIGGWRGASAFGPTFVVADAASDSLVGVVFLRADRETAVEIAYGIAPDHRGAGIATAVLQAVSRWCFARTGVERIELRIAPSNLASRRVAEKSGFRSQGIERTQVPGTTERYEDLLYVLARSDEPGRPSSLASRL